MTQEVYFLYAWNKFCVDTAGVVLPLNYLSTDGIGYEVDDLAPPLQTTEGPVRRVVLLHPEGMRLDS